MQALQTRLAPITAAQRAAVAELMTPTENPFSRPSITMPNSIGDELLLAPAEPVDKPGDDE